jgi:hypothetical protein
LREFERLFGQVVAATSQIDEDRVRFRKIPTGRDPLERASASVVADTGADTSAVDFWLLKLRVLFAIASLWL